MPSSTDRPAADTSVPVASACSTVAASAARGDGGGGFHLSGGTPPPPCRSPLPPPPTTMGSPASPEGRALAAHTADTPRFLAPAAGFSFPSYVSPAPVPAAARRGRPPGPEASVDPTARHQQSPSPNSTR
jgi:hypothetical protein